MIIVKEHTHPSYIISWPNVTDRNNSQIKKNNQKLATQIPCICRKSDQHIKYVVYRKNYFVNQNKLLFKFFFLVDLYFNLNVLWFETQLIFVLEKKFNCICKRPSIPFFEKNSLIWLNWFFLIDFSFVIQIYVIFFSFITIYTRNRWMILINIVNIYRFFFLKVQLY